MKRSEINAAISHAIHALEANHYRLPDFAYWPPSEWKKHDIENIKAVGLGWDVTDFGTGDFPRVGAVLFTVRNGNANDPTVGTPYAEKMIFQLHETEQEIPFHFHIIKTEDIINRGGGVLMLELYNSAADGKLCNEREVKVKMDGFWRTFPPGCVVEITKGNSITLPPGLHHRFWAKKGAGDLIVGEVSSINDDMTDNVFLEVPKRFAEIEEDEPAQYLLCGDY
ncbi:MAG: D-lyxose/D-mannose family sugar isomerase [Defluviitaleaceae bacterium]|nr:D-lyxose/D-mannose family sugar isomerase [Defluviitaleaceae bacterium]